MKDTRRITEGALMTGIYLLLLLVIIFIPGIIGAILMFVLPVPFIYYSYRHGFKAGILVFIVSTLVSIIFGLAFSLPTTLLAGVGGLFVGGSMHKKRSSYETLAMGSVGFIIGFVAVYFISQTFFGVNWADQINEMIEQSISMSEKMLSDIGGSGDAEERLEQFREQLSTLPDLIPSMFAIAGILFAFISQWASYKLINRVEKKDLHFPAFRDFKLPTSLLWYYFFSFMLQYFIEQDQGVLYLAAINVNAITGLLILLQGFSFIFFYAHKKKLSKAIPILSIVITLFIPTILMYFVRILGIIDIGFSLRNRVKEKE
ncbi:YybS family protein [Halobacillus salinarum]|uniref:YybS family protein n=1 Tax=Halobacillus salinarum TaxID=2932257 RepID=A0ABY4EJY6_9BACI|nr:YybS family protein [Halobacillus salinarum]UOQ44782.1 YybS family protein [Halobacillus salinarum]